MRIHINQHQPGRCPASKRELPWVALILASVVLAVSAQGVLAQPNSACSREGSVGSAKTTQVDRVILTNQSNETLLVYWLNFEGKRQKWFDLPAGQAFEQSTYVGHLWLVTKPNGQCLAIFSAPGSFAVGKTQSSINSNRQTRPQNPPNVQPRASASGNADVFIAQGDKYVEAKDYAKAIEAYKKAIEFQPSASAYSRLGNSYFYDRKYPEALAAHQQVLRIEPNAAAVHFNLGLVYRPMQQYEKAIVSFREAVRLKPDYAAAFKHIGLTYYYNLENFPEAARAFEQAVRLEPNNTEFLKYLGEAYVDMRRKADAQQIYQRLLKIDPVKAKELAGNIAACLERDAQVLLTAGLQTNEDNPYNSLRYLHHAIASGKLDPQALPEAHQERGRVFIVLKRYEEAFAEFREAIRLNPKQPEYYLDLGKADLAAGKKAQAQQIYATLKRLDPKLAEELLAEINKSK